MAYRFPLRSLLRLKRSIERQERLHLAALIRQINSRIVELEELVTARLGAGNRLSESLKDGLLGAEIRFHDAATAMLRRRETLLQEELAVLEQRRLAQQLVVQRARQQREVVENLETRLEALHNLDRDRRQQRQLDDTTIARWSRTPA